MKFLILLTLFLVSSPVFSQGRAFCERNRQDILSLMQEPSARIAFKNAGGLANGGVCWWHSRLQRSSFFLVKYAPQNPRPNQRQLNSILAGLRSMDRVITIPGFADFQSFTRTYQKEIQRLLNDWQLFDGLYNFQWLRGISGKPVLPANQMVARMDAVYDAYRKSPAAMWIMAQMAGITSHSFLVLHMEKVNGGYDLDLIDSNHPMEVVTVAYQEGDQTLRSNRSNTAFVPYVGFQEDFRKISRGLSGYCRNKSNELLLDFSDIRDGEIELPNQGDDQLP
jgi:hypothetical protein